ncbi:DNRLRE domain-containing protein [Actinomycetes bacterium KLBMP 9797]
MSRSPTMSTPRRTLAVGLSAALVVGLGAAVMPAPAAAEAQPVLAREAAQPLERPDEAAALVTARTTGKRVRIGNMTTPTTEFWALPTGAVEGTVTAGPVRMRGANGDWVAVDLALKPRADGSVAPVAHPYGLTLAGAKAAGEHTLLSLAGGTTLGWSGVLPEPVLEGNKATYREVRPGVDLVVSVTRTGYEQLLVVKNRQAAAQVREVRMAFQPGKGQQTAKKVGELPAVMWDARVDAASGERTHRARVGTAAAGNKVVLTPDQKFLADPSTVYPVTIDPSQSLGVNFDAFVQNTYTSDQSTATELKVGTHNAGTDKARSFLRFDNLSWLWDKQVTNATLSLWNHHSYSCTARDWQAWRVSDVTSSVRWTAQPSWVEQVGTSTQTKGFSSSCGDGWVTVPVTAAFQDVTDLKLGSANIGIRSVSETDSYTWKRFNSKEGANPPAVTLTYESRTTVTAQGTAPASVCATGTARPFVNTLTPQLRAQVTDGAGAQVWATFEWYAAGGARIGSRTEGPGASGSWLSTTVPDGAFVDGGTYSWRVQGGDGSSTGTWSAFCEFTIDTLAPMVAPNVASTVYIANDWAGAAGTAGNFTFTAGGVADVAAYEYGVDANPPNQIVNAPSLGADATVAITPTTDGPHTLYVRARDRAGNVSPLRTYSFSVGGGAVTSPKPGDITAAKAAISGIGKSTATGVTYQWRRGDADTWTTIPAGHVTVAAGGGAVTWPMASTGGGAFAKLNWDVESTLAATDAQTIARDGPLQVRGAFTGGTAANSAPVKITFDRNQAGGASKEVGPGSVNLITGDYTLGDTDVTVDSYGSDLTVSRSYNTRRAGQVDASGMFGPGWTSGTLVEDAEADYTSLTVFGSLVQIGLPDGDTLGFSKRNATAFDPEIGLEALRLTYASATDSYTLADIDGNSTVFTRVTGSAAGKYAPTSVTTPGANQVSAMSWERATVGGVEVVRPTRMLAPVPDGVVCTTLSRGCRALSFTYATATTATGTTEATWGDYTGRVSQISVTAWDPDLATPAMRTVVMAKYAYDNTGRLRATWDPRLDWTENGVTKHLWETYGYQADGVLNTVKPAGQEAWNFTYTALPSDPGAGRLHKVSRSALSAGTATDTVVYKVPTAGTGAPYNLAAAQTARWGQPEAPTDATAVFPANQVPSGNPATGTLPSSYERAVVTYLDANARTVNTVTPGGHTSAAWYDEWGNAVRELSATNRARALADAPSDTAEREAILAERYSTRHTFSADGQKLVYTLNPERDVMLADGATVVGRTVNRQAYDQGAPASGGPYNLATTEEVLVRYWGASGTEATGEVRTKTTAYNWALRAPTVTTVDPAGLAQTTRTSYDPSTAQETAETEPQGGTATTTPFTTKTIYYRATSGSGYAECDLRPEWANLPCRTQPGGQAASGPELAATVTTYDLFNQPRVVTEKTSAGTLRTTTTTYDAAARAYEVAVTGPGTAVPIERNVYDRATGQVVRTQQITGGLVTAEIVRQYDTLGRMTSYKDADGNVSTTTYDLLGRVATSTDGIGTRSYGYDGGGERRGLLTSVSDSVIGGFTASYDPDGRLTSEMWPNGIQVTTEYAPDGSKTDQAYVRPNCGAADCTLFRESVTSSPHGEVREHSSTLSEQVYSYDKAGRLAEVRDIVGERCTTRVYGLDKAANRTSLTEYGPAADGTCQTGTAAASRSWSYDAAERITGAGYQYDTLGRTTAVPAADTANPAGGAVTVTYHANDLVDTITQGERSADYALDVTGERVRSWIDTVSGEPVTSTHHYSDDGDSPAWTQEGPNLYTRVIDGLAGFAGVWNSASGAVDWQITNLHGDVVATISGDEAGLSSTSEANEYGIPQDSTEVGTQRYGWLGGAQRAADAPSGLILMGVRLYNTVTGRFLQIDPVPGGGCGRYEYTCADPTNTTDLDGKWCLVRCWIKKAAKKIKQFRTWLKKVRKGLSSLPKLFSKKNLKRAWKNKYVRACAVGAGIVTLVDILKLLKKKGELVKSLGKLKVAIRFTGALAFAGCVGGILTKIAKDKKLIF